MDISTQATQATQNLNAAQKTAGSSSPLNSDFNTFLKMLTVQMQNQDPLNPIDSSDYAVQLATFSNVEQQVKTNKLLTALTTHLGSDSLSQLSNWVGKEARVKAPAYFDKSPITFAPPIAQSADKAEVIVRNSQNQIVDRKEIPLEAKPITWAGTTKDGKALPSGEYKFEVVSYKDGKEILKETASVYSKITEVRKEAGQTVLVLKGGVLITPQHVTALKQ